MITRIINLNFILTILAIIGMLGGIYMLILDKRPIPVSQPLILPAVPPFESFISGAGIVEAASENIRLGTMVDGVIDKILVKKGDIVSKEQTLFTLDNRQAIANLKKKQALLGVSKTALEQAQASLRYAEHELDLVNRVKDKRGITKEELINRQDNVFIAQKSVKNAQALVESAQAEVNEAQTVLEFYTVKAPMDCKVMQISICPGEYATATAPLMLVGNVNRYHIRVNVDENDAWRFDNKQPAIAFLRGNIQYHTNLQFEYIEPYVIPKRFLTGDTTERVDTRVLQVVYSYDPRDMPAYLGQEVDVYIQAAKIPSNTQYGGPLSVSR